VKAGAVRTGAGPELLQQPASPPALKRVWNWVTKALANTGTYSAETGDICYSFAPDPALIVARQPVTLPPAVIASNNGGLRNHTHHAAAKADHNDAAFRAVRDTITPTFIEQVRALIGNESPVIVPVLAIEQGGDNKLPAQGAARLANVLGI
jgi:hypothetical protein